MRIGSPLHVMKMSSSLNMLMPSFVKTKPMLSSDVLPMLIRDVRKSCNVSTCLDCADIFQKGRLVTYLALLGTRMPSAPASSLRINWSKVALCTGLYLYFLCMACMAKQSSWP
jgi:hypothetical protein